MSRPPATPRWPIDEILARTDLAALLDEYAQPDQRPRRWHCPLPDHGDTHASVTMHRDQRGHERWRCWSGDDRHRGDAIDLIQAVRGGTRSEAIDELAGRAGMHRERELPPIPERRPTVPPPARVLDERVVGYATVCSRLLWSPLGASVRDWLHARGLHDDVLRHNLVGADPGRERLRRARGIPYGAGVGATFPALDPSGQIRYVQTRALEPRPGYGKYDNPAASLAPNPRLTWAQPPNLRHPDQLVICEGIPDALIATQGDYRSVALIGSWAADRGVASRLALHADDGARLVAVFEADDAGRQAAARLRHLVDTHGHDLRIVEPPVDGWDLNDWARHHPNWAAELADTINLEHPTPSPARRDLEVDL